MVQSSSQSAHGGFILTLLMAPAQRTLAADLEKYPISAPAPPQSLVRIHTIQISFTRQLSSGLRNQSDTSWKLPRHQELTALSCSPVPSKARAKLPLPSAWYSMKPPAPSLTASKKQRHQLGTGAPRMLIPTHAFNWYIFNLP